MQIRFINLGKRLKKTCAGLIRPVSRYFNARVAFGSWLGVKLRVTLLARFA